MTTKTLEKVRPEKASIVQEIEREVADAAYVFVMEFDKLTVAQLEDLRAQLHGCDARFKVVKNRLFARVAMDRGWEALHASLSGATGIIAGNGEITEAAKTVSKFVKDAEDTEIRAGMLGEEFLSAEDVAALASLPSREVLYGQLVGTLAAPMSQLVGVMSQKVASVVYVLKAVADKKQG